MPLATHVPQKVGQASRLPYVEADRRPVIPLVLAHSRGRRDACPALGPLRFMVPIRARNDVESAHELHRTPPVQCRSHSG
jgi:hypothetical protein